MMAKAPDHLPPGTELTVRLPNTGEEIDISKPEGAAHALDAIKAFEYELKEVQRTCRQVLRDEADKRGQRTFDLGAYKVVVENPGWERVYDVALLEDGLMKAGLEFQRVGKLITYEPKVDGKIIRELEKHPQYKAVIDAATLSVHEKTRLVKVKP